jgi:hypothetical protein
MVLSSAKPLACGWDLLEATMQRPSAWIPNSTPSQARFNLNVPKLPQGLSMFPKAPLSRIGVVASHLLHHGIVMCFGISLSVGHQFLGLRCSGSLLRTFSL